MFTAGIGEHVPAIRADVCTRLGWLGLRLDAAANAAAANSAIEVRVIATNEEAVIAHHARSIIEQTVTT